MIEVKCPHCDYARDVPAEKIPAGRRTVTCPQCREKFPFDKNAILADLLTASIPSPSAATPNSESASPALELSNNNNRLSPLKVLGPDIWRLIKSKGWVVVGTWLAATFLVISGGTLFTAATAALIDVSGNSALVTGSAIVLGIILCCYALGWWLAAVMCAVVVDEITVTTALAGGRTYAWRYFWLMTLLGHMLVGGTLLFFIPGIVFYVWFFFAQYLLVAENVRGMDALLLSRAYVRGYGWGICGRLLLLSLLLWVITLLLGFIPIIGPLLVLLLWPFALLMPKALYLELRALNPAPPREFSRSVKAVWLILGTLGYLLIPAALFWGGTALIEHLSTGFIQLNIMP
ncbi:MAG: zinc-ribbon domain-containing protein [Desulfuromonadales bacterium]|nr:zinc-ribbon domain-containing protein [Desulfuromonadales bacterium]